MRKHLIMLGLGIVAMGLQAQEPMWLLNAAGSGASIVAPSSWGSGNSYTSAGLGLEFQPNPRVGAKLGYDYFGIAGSNVNAGASVLGLGAQLYLYDFSNSKLFLGGGIGFDLSANNPVGGYSGHADLGLRWRLHERVALDTLVTYRVFTPVANLIQGVGLGLGVSVPLDAPFGSAKPMAPKAAPANPVKLEVPQGVATDISQGKTLSPTAKPAAKKKAVDSPLHNKPKKK